MNMSKTYIKEEILKILRENKGYAEETAIIDVIRQTHQNDITKKEGNETGKRVRPGYSQLTIRRRIKILDEEGAINIIKDDKKLEVYGIHRSDKRSAVLMLLEAKEERDHLDSVFGKFSKSNNKTDVIRLIEETELSKNITLLTPLNLDTLADKLKIEDDGLIWRIIVILYDHACKNVFPQHTETVIEEIKRLLSKMQIPASFFVELKEGNVIPNIGLKFNIYEYAIWLLGAYKSDQVIEELLKTVNLIRKEDLPETITPDKKHTYNLYVSEFNPFLKEQVKFVIEKNKSRLFEIEHEYRKKKNDLAAEYLFRVRQRIAFLNEQNKEYITPAIPHDSS